MNSVVRILIPVAITLTITGLTAYYLYKKYQPTIAAANGINTGLGYIEHPIDSIETIWSTIFGASALVGNGNNLTPSMTT